MNKDEVFEIAKQAKATPYTNRFVKDTAFAFGPESLALFVAEVERRTLERAAAVCVGIANKPSNVVLGVAIECATAIRALKEKT